MADAAAGEIEDDRLGRRIVADPADQLDRPSGARPPRARRATRHPPAAIAPSTIRPIGDPMTTITALRVRAASGSAPVGPIRSPSSLAGPAAATAAATVVVGAGRPGVSPGLWVSSAAASPSAEACASGEWSRPARAVSPGFGVARRPRAARPSPSASATRTARAVAGVGDSDGSAVDVGRPGRRSGRSDRRRARCRRGAPPTVDRAGRRSAHPAASSDEQDEGEGLGADRDRPAAGRRDAPGIAERRRGTRRSARRGPPTPADDEAWRRLQGDRGHDPILEPVGRTDRSPARAHRARARSPVRRPARPSRRLGRLARIAQLGRVEPAATARSCVASGFDRRRAVAAVRAGDGS